jgi:hypothetical protein
MTYVEENPGSGGPKFTTTQKDGIDTPWGVLAIEEDGVAVPVSEDAPVPTKLTDIGDAASDSSIIALGVLLQAIQSLLGGTLAVSASDLPLPAGAATQTTLAAVLAALGSTLAVSGPVTDTQLRASAVPTNEKYGFSSVSASGSVKNGSGTLGGFLCTASSSGTVTIYDNTASSGTKIVDTMSVTAGQPYPVPVNFNNGCYIVIGGTATITVFYN